MRFRGLLIAAVVLAALLGLVHWSKKAKSNEASKPFADTTPKLLSIPEDQFRRIEIRKAGTQAATIVEKDASGKWEITAPQKLAADQDAMSSMVSTLSSLSSDKLIEEKASDLASYGLASPSFQVTVTKKDGKTQALSDRRRNAHRQRLLRQARRRCARLHHRQLHQNQRRQDR